MSATLLIALSLPGDGWTEQDPDDIADVLVAIINEERVRNGGADTVGFDSPEVEPVMVSAIPSPAVAHLRDLGEPPRCGGWRLTGRGGRRWLTRR